MDTDDKDYLEFWEQPYCLDRPIKPLDIVKFKISGGFSHISLYVTPKKPEELNYRQRGLLTSSTEDSFMLERSICKYVGHIRTMKSFTVVFKPSRELQISTRTMNVTTSLQKFKEEGVWLLFFSNFADISVLYCDTLPPLSDLKRSMSFHIKNVCSDNDVPVSVSSCQTDDLVSQSDKEVQVDNMNDQTLKYTESEVTNIRKLCERIESLEKLNEILENDVKKMVKALHNKTEINIFEDKIEKLSRRLDEILGVPSKHKVGGEERWKQIVRSNYTSISQDIQAVEIAQFMYQKRIIGLNTFDRIRQIKTPNDAAHEILSIILKRPLLDHMFCECLRETEHHHIIDEFFEEYNNHE